MRNDMPLYITPRGVRSCHSNTPRGVLMKGILQPFGSRLVRKVCSLSRNNACGLMDIYNVGANRKNRSDAETKGGEFILAFLPRHRFEQ